MEKIHLFYTFTFHKKYDSINLSKERGKKGKNMIYYIKENRLNEGIKENRIVKKDPYDLRNFAITLLYPNNVEQVFRNKYLNYHIEYLYPLYQNSQIIKDYIAYPLNQKEYNHLQFDLQALKNKIGLIYCNNPAKQNEQEYIFYLPETITSFQKEYLNIRKKDILKLQKSILFIYQFQKENLISYKEIEDFRSSTPYQAIRKMIQK